MATVDEIALGAKVSLGTFTKNINQMRSKLSGFASGLKSMKGALAGIGIAAGAALAANTIKNWTSEGLESVDTMSKLSQKTGVGTEALAGLALQADLSGVSLTKLESSIGKVNKLSGEAALGNEKAAATLKMVGISAEELSSLSPEEKLARIADTIKGISDPGEKAAVAMRVFGKSGAELIPMLNGGSAAMAEAEAEAKAFGLAFTELDGIKVENANDSMTRLGKLFEGIKTQLAVQLAPIISTVMDMFVTWGKEGFSAADMVAKGIEWAVIAIGFLMDTWQLFGDAFRFTQSAITKAIALLVDSFLLFPKAIQTLLNMLPGVQVDMTSTMDAISADMHKLAGEQWDGAVKKFGEKPKSEGLKDALAAARKKADETAAAMIGVNKEKDDFAAKMKAEEEAEKKKAEALKAGEDAIAQLQMKLKVLREGEDAAARWELAQKGVNVEQRKTIELLQKQVKAEEEKKKAQEEAQKAAEEARKEFEDKMKSIKDSVKTPLDTLREALEELSDPRASKFLTPNEIAQAKKNAMDEFNEAQPDDTPKFAEAMEVGSQSARSALLNFMGGGQSGNDPAAIAAKQLEEQIKARQDFSNFFTSIGDFFKNDEPMPVELSATELESIDEKAGEQVDQLIAAVGFLRQIATTKTEELIFSFN